MNPENKTMVDSDSVLLSSLKVGEGGLVEAIDGSKHLNRRLNSLGIIIGLHIVVSNISFGLIAVKMNGSKIALSKSVASKIYVRKMIEKSKENNE